VRIDDTPAGVAFMSSLRLQSRSYVAGLLAGVFGCALLFAMAWRMIDHLPQYDELFHFLAARGIRAHGMPAIADGTYDRAEMFTWLVAGAIKAFGDSLMAARIPSLLASAGLLMLMTLWVTRRVDLLAGVTAAIVLCLLPATLDLAVFIRFYTVHALLVMGMSIALYEAAARQRPLGHRIGLAVAAAVLLVLAMHFQVTTLIAFAAVAAAVGAVLLVDHWKIAMRFFRRHPGWIAAGAVVAVVGGSVALSGVGMVDELRKAPLWASPSANRPQYYLIEIARDTPLLWPMFPVAVLVALFFGNRRLTIFCVVVLLLALVVHSIAAAKTMRYIYYALPFLCVIWGCALSGLYAVLARVEMRSIGLSTRSVAPLALLVAALVLALSQEGQRAARLVFGKLDTDPTANYDGETDWSPAVATLRPLLSSADRVVTSNAMKALYYFGRYDYDLNATIVPETLSREEFGLDERTGRHAISTARSIAQVLGMPGTTLVVLEEMRLGLAVGVPADALETIAARCSVVVVPPAAGLRAWRCPNGNSP
jgi:hypothetical protein